MKRVGKQLSLHIPIGFWAIDFVGVVAGKKGKWVRATLDKRHGESLKAFTRLRGTRDIRSIVGSMMMMEDDPDVRTLVVDANDMKASYVKYCSELEQERERGPRDE